MIHDLDASNLSGLTPLLAEAGVLADGEALTRADTAGPGNMNRTLRVWTTARTLIVKQAHPWVERYPHIPASASRGAMEARFYALVQAAPEVASRMPALLAAIPDHRLLVFEDLGPSSDFTGIYGDVGLADGVLDALVDWLSALHALPFEGDRLVNEAMRALNHAHIFDLPLRPEGPMPLDPILPGLEAEARALRADAALRFAALELGDRYLSEHGDRLLHGDFYPGSWLAASDGVRIIDPEFGFHGLPEIDVGFLLGHLVLARCHAAHRDRIFARYRPPLGFDPALARAFAGIEVIRRIIGVAQLPLAADLPTRAAMLRWGRAMVLGNQ